MRDLNFRLHYKQKFDHLLVGFPLKNAVIFVHRCNKIYSNFYRRTSYQSVNESLYSVIGAFNAYNLWRMVSRFRLQKMDTHTGSMFISIPTEEFV